MSTTLSTIFGDVWNVLVVKDGTWVVSQLAGSKYKIPTEEELTALGQPVLSLATTAFEKEVTTLLTATPALTLTNISATLTPKADTLISGVVGALKTSNPLVDALEGDITKFLQGQVPALITAAYNAALTAINSVVANSASSVVAGPETE